MLRDHVFTVTGGDVTVPHCRIPPELHRRLRHLMVDEGCSVTALVNDFLEAGLRERGRIPGCLSPRDRMRRKLQTKRGRGATH